MGVPMAMERVGNKYACRIQVMSAEGGLRSPRGELMSLIVTVICKPDDPDRNCEILEKITKDNIFAEGRGAG